jgi:hypothetical protein
MARALSSGASFSMARLLTLSANVRLPWNNFSRKNTPAYFTATSVMKKKVL